MVFFWQPSSNYISLKINSLICNGLEVLFIPAYSPELNPQEYLNQDLKTNIIGKKRAINKEQLKKNINNFMSKRKKDKPQVKKYFHHRHAQYAA